MKTSSQIAELERLFKQFQPPLVLYANSFLTSREDAMEIVQDVFISVWNNKENLVLNAELKAYLYTATRNKCYNFLQKRKLPTVSLNVAARESVMGYNTEDQLETDELRAEIFEEINQLPGKCREIFFLSRQEGLSYKQIADKLNIAEKTVENQIGIALKKIRKRLFKG